MVLSFVVYLYCGCIDQNDNEIFSLPPGSLFMVGLSEKHIFN